MRKIIFLMTSLVLLVTSNSLGQSIGDDLRTDTCITCNDPKNNIHDNGDNTFTATTAQAYYWEICSGTATILGSNTNQTVTVSGLIGTTSRIRLTRFNNGNCYEYCEIFTIIDPTVCVDIEPQLYGKAYCVSNRRGNVKINSSVDISTYASVTWYLDSILNGSAYNGFTFDSSGGTISSEKTNSNGYFNETFDFVNPCPTSNIWYFDVLIKYNNGCPDYFANDIAVDLDVLAPIVNIYPNPSQKGNKIAFDGIDFNEVNSIEILDVTGNLKKNIKPSEQTFTTEGLTSGLYIVKFTTTEEKIIQKKLVIK